MGVISQAAVNATILGSLGVNGIGIAIGGHELLEKIANGEQLTALELFQFSSSLLFFTNAMVTAKTADRMIRTVGLFCCDLF